MERLLKGHCRLLSLEVKGLLVTREFRRTGPTFSWPFKGSRRHKRKAELAFTHFLFQSPFLSGRPSSSSVTKGNKPFRSKFPSPFRNRKNLHPGPGTGCSTLYSGQQTPTLAKNIPYSALSSTNSPTQPLGPEEQELEAALGLEKPSISKEELLRLYIQKLDEEANYFKASSPTEDDLCDCPKCQVSTHSLY